MNAILETKLRELESAGDYECWYLVKQPTAFDALCYLVSFLKKYKTVDAGNNLQDYITIELSKLHETKPNPDISNNYRALRVAAFFGLIKMTSSKYEEAVITDTFNEWKRPKRSISLNGIGASLTIVLFKRSNN